MDKLRLRFTKTGKAVYISHLDLMRTMQRAFLRAGYPLKYSEGFNPHAQISILLPLSVGAYSNCELMDFQLREDVDLALVPDTLSAAMPSGIRVLEAYEGGRKVKELKWLRVKGVFEYDEGDIDAICAAVNEFYSAASIVISKRTKRGIGESDIAPAIKEISFSAGDGALNMEAVISAQEPTLNPELLADALRQLRPDIAPDFARFERLEIYDEKMQIFR